MKRFTIFFTSLVLFFANSKTLLAAELLCDDKKGIYTAIGCIPVQNTDALAAWLLKWALGFAGGIALFFIIYAGFQIITSAGDPKKVQSGRELLTSSISGLLFLLFSVFILRFIGVDILEIPGF